MIGGLEPGVEGPTKDPLLLFLETSRMCPAAMARERFSSLESLSATAAVRCSVVWCGVGIECGNDG